jgi:hypothetical protein
MSAEEIKNLEQIVYKEPVKNFIGFYKECSPFYEQISPPNLQFS